MALLSLVITVPDSVVYNAESLVAHAVDEPGATTVTASLDAVGSGDTVGYVNWVNVTEVRYIIARTHDRETAEEYIDWLFELGLAVVTVEQVWSNAAEHVLSSNPALGDSFALATADHTDAALLVGGDTDYDEVTAVPIHRFRDGLA